MRSRPPASGRVVPRHDGRTPTSRIVAHAPRAIDAQAFDLELHARDCKEEGKYESVVRVDPEVCMGSGRGRGWYAAMWAASKGRGWPCADELGFRV